jgi:hypothetical protein
MNTFVVRIHAGEPHIILALLARLNALTRQDLNRRNSLSFWDFRAIGSF